MTSMKLLFAVVLSLMVPNMAQAQQQEQPKVSVEDFRFDEVNYSSAKTVFTLFAPDDAKVTLRLYRQPLGGKPTKTVRMQRVSHELWQAEVKGDLLGQFYTFDIGRGETPGVFAKAVGTNGQRGAIVQMSASPSGFR